MAAISALHAKLPLLTVHIYPAGKKRSDRIELLGICGGKEVLLVDAARTPELGPYLQATSLLGALDGKTAAHAIMATFGVHVPRWACATLSQTLLNGGALGPWTLAELAQAHGIAPPNTTSDASGGALDAFAQQAQTIALVLQAQMHAIKQHALREVSRIEAAAVSPIVLMETHGMPMDAGRLATCITHDEQQMANLAAKLGQVIGTPVSPAWDDRQLLEALSRQGHPLPSLSETKLKQSRGPLFGPLAEFVALRRLGRTVGKGFAKHIDPDGRIRPHFVQIGARSGRMACTRPNLQAITSDAARRACFRAPPGHVMVMGDYAACELRILAQMSQDQALKDDIARGLDLHGTIATRMFGTEVSREVQPHLRHTAKTIAFGLIYGMGPSALAQALQTRRPEAQALMAQFFGAFPRVQAHLTEASEAAQKRGLVRTLSGRICSLNDGPTDLAGQLRLARNMPIQGTSADLIKLALARATQSLSHLAGCQVVHCIHDELLVVCPEGAQQEVMPRLKAAMEGAGAALLPDVSLRADVACRVDWQAH